MPTLGKLLVIWGALLPLLAFLSMRGFHHERGLVGSLGQMHTFILGEEVSFAGIVVLSLMKIYAITKLG